MIVGGAATLPAWIHVISELCQGNYKKAGIEAGITVFGGTILGGVGVEGISRSYSAFEKRELKKQAQK